MGSRVVYVNGRAISFVGDDQPPLGDRFSALVRARVIDELTGAPPVSAISIDTTTKGLTPRIASGGVCGFTGIPRNAFPALASQNYSVRFTVGADGYVPREQEIQVPQTLEFPILFSPPPLMDIPLHRKPTIIHGRTVHTTGSVISPLASASVRITGIWRTLPPVSMSIPPLPANVVSLAPPLYADRGAGVGRLRRRNIPAVIGDDKTLRMAAEAGEDQIELSNRQNLTVGDIVLIDALDPDLVEYMAILAIDGVSSPDQHARVTLSYPLAYPHAKGAMVREGNPLPFGGVRILADDAQRGDTCVFVNSLSGLASANVVQVSGGPTEEYHQVRVFTVTSDAEGYYRLPPLSRIAQVEIRAEHGALTPVRTEFRPDYASNENRLDFIFR